VPSRMSRTIGSSASERAFHASQSVFTLRQTLLLSGCWRNRHLRPQLVQSRRCREGDGFR
jgi:hypothetical protein